MRKIDSNGTLLWTSAYSYQPDIKSLSVDSLEQNVYFGVYSFNYIVVMMKAFDGDIVNIHTQ